jgi:hypothetical protein
MRKRIALLLAVIGLLVVGIAGPAQADEETSDPGYGTTCDQACIDAWLASGDDGSGKMATTGIVRSSCSTGGWAVGAHYSGVDSYTVVPKQGYIVNTLWLATAQSSYSTPYGTLTFYRYQITWVNLKGQVQNQYRYTPNSSVLTPSLYGGAKAGTMTVNAYWRRVGTTFSSHCIAHNA